MWEKEKREEEESERAEVASLRDEVGDGRVNFDSHCRLADVK